MWICEGKIIPGKGGEVTDIKDIRAGL